MSESRQQLMNIKVLFLESLFLCWAKGICKHTNDRSCRILLLICIFYLYLFFVVLDDKVILAWCHKVYIEVHGHLLFLIALLLHEGGKALQICYARVLKLKTLQNHSWPIVLIILLL